ncbi:MAG TPA: hypothetical protein PK657_01075 [Legionella sp.]|nr:hypothetical protein [Legionella sp.]
MKYYPDVLFFQLNKIQYTSLMERLSSSRYIYTNGIEIRPTNWLMYVTQSIKGWFGFTNNCRPEKIAYTLNKLAYFGYVHGLLEDPLPEMVYYPLSAKIVELVRSERNDKNSADLQNKLIEEYFKSEPFLDIDTPLESGHRYGDSWLKAGLTNLAPLMNPQNDSLITEVINSIDSNNYSADGVLFELNSKFSFAAAEHYYLKCQNTNPSIFSRLFKGDPRKGYLEQSLSYNKNIAYKYPLQFIPYYLEKKAYPQVIALLPFVNNADEVLRILLCIPEALLLATELKDTQLVIPLAKHYVIKKEYQKAQQLYTNIEAISPHAAYDIAMKDKKYELAYNIVQRNQSNYNFLTEELAEIFFNLAEDQYNYGKIKREQKNWTEAKTFYLQSVMLKKRAVELNPCDNYKLETVVHKRLYALLLIDEDIDLNKPEESNSVAICEAINLLRECQPDDSDELDEVKKVLAKGFMRSVDSLKEKISVTGASEYVDLKNHKLQFRVEFSALIKTLGELITLLADTKDKALKLILGKAYFIFADVHTYFDINLPNINQYYLKAYEQVPENPFYALRVAELFPEKKELQTKAILKVNRMGYVNGALDYFHWFDERWVKSEKMIYDIKCIHQLARNEAEQSKLFSFKN